MHLNNSKNSSNIKTPIPIDKNSSRIYSLQALRALAFLGIFLNHAGYHISWPALGVSIFFIMSGFLMMKNHGDNEFNIGFKANLVFSIKRISKIYKLHIITMLLAIVLDLIRIFKNHESIMQLFKLLVKALLNTALIQSWVPKNTINTSLNGVAWYLSVAAFLYFMFPTLTAFIKKYCIRPHLSFIAVLLLIILIQTLACIPFLLYSINSDIYIWFMYCFPIFRCGEFVIGMLLYRTFAHSAQSPPRISNNKSRFMLYSLFEIIGVLITIIPFVNINLHVPTIISQAFHNWTTIFIIPASIWVYLFALQEGIITNILSNRILIALGNISSYAFLIHFVIILYAKSILEFTNITIQGSIINILVLAEFLLTIVLSIIYRNITTEK